MVDAEASTSNLGRVRAVPPALGTFRAMAGFRPAALAAAAVSVRHFEEHRLMSRVLNDRGRFAVGLAVLDLGFGGADGAPLTAARLQDFCDRHGICSRGRAKATLAVMRVMGLVAPGGAGDRRMKALVPTPALMTLHRERWGDLLAAAEPLTPVAAPALAALHDDRFLAAFVRRMSARFEAGFRVLETAPALLDVAERSAGLVTLLAIYSASGGAAGPRRVVITDLARRFLVSRGHVLEILRAAEAAGLLALSGRTAATADLAPAFAETIERFLDAAFSAVADAAEAGLAALR